ncbi:hypothetical protein ALC57_14362 [Trachymyrmex cornetzi]|uniref:Uncharacterized protein n=1 Tax=Trachymyrmex cornetzi TaxID=471704 RepID=A0A195DLH4_9HYME|nr:hypothetical protein ALC57_14362 [Trachymyrmex cornetzi]
MNKLNNKWFINLSKTHIPDYVHALLQLGENFCLPTTEILTYVRNSIISFINGISFKKNAIEKNVLKMLLATKNFIRENPNIIYTHADKGNEGDSKEPCINFATSCFEIISLHVQLRAAWDTANKSQPPVDAPGAVAEDFREE